MIAHYRIINPLKQTHNSSIPPLLLQHRLLFIHEITSFSLWKQQKEFCKQLNPQISIFLLSLLNMVLVWDQQNVQFWNVCWCILDALWRLLVMVVGERVYFHLCLHQTFTPCMLGERDTLFLLFGEWVCTNQLPKIRQRWHECIFCSPCCLFPQTFELSHMGHEYSASGRILLSPLQNVEV